MKKMLLIFSLFFSPFLSLQSQAQTIVRNPMGDVSCKCAEILPIALPYLSSGSEITFICARLTNWSFDTFATGNYFFLIKNYQDDTTFYYSKMSTQDLPNGGNFQLTGIPLTAPLSFIPSFVFSYIASTQQLDIKFK